MSDQNYGYDQSGQGDQSQYGQDPNQQQMGQDPNQQQMGGQMGQDPNQQQMSQDPNQQQMSQDPNQQQMGGQMGQDPNQQQTGGQMGQDQLSGARQQAQDQVDSTIDQFANKVPGGQQFSQQAKDAANQGLGNIEQEAENKLGGMFGGGGQGNQ